ncbi:MAG: hypothetical protein QOF78_4010, partial [Phycisphaerales bacterium]|nr:hypothetical protein [Phycisphaerales bacterium]
MDELNHAEVLFNRGIQREVALILDGGLRGALADEIAKVQIALPTTQVARGVELPRQIAVAATAPAAGAIAPAGTVQQNARTALNPKMKGRLGRIVVAFPKDFPCKDTHVSIRRSGNEKDIQSFYGSGEIELLPATYTVLITSKATADVTVQPHSDTKISIGVLHVNAGKDTHVELLDADGKTKLTSGYGE